MDWQVDTWVIVQYDEQWYPGIIQEVRLENAHSQSTKLLMCKQETLVVPVVYQNNYYYLLFFLLDQFSVHMKLFSLRCHPLLSFFIFSKKIKILKC